MTPDKETGNLVVVAGAGTGKTYKLVQTVLQRIEEGTNVEELLVVTFTKAAAAELRERIAIALQKAFAEKPDSAFLARQIGRLDRAQISTLHSFCLELATRHFAELDLSPRVTTLEDTQAKILQAEALDALFESYYDGNSPRSAEIKSLLLDWFSGDDEAVRAIVLKLHGFTQTRPDPGQWFAEQRARLAADDAGQWRTWWQNGVEQWDQRWRGVLLAQPGGEKNPARDVVLGHMDKFDVKAVAEVATNKSLWPRGSVGRYRDPLEKFFDEAATLAGWVKSSGSDPLLEDWKLCRPVAIRLLDIAEEFVATFTTLKRERGFVDFHDLEQLSLQLLWRDGKPSAIAEEWRRKFKWIFVDEYQDINRAQDRIIEALGREPARGNRFLVGDVKQSIYGFRQAEPRVFQGYEEHWGAGDGGDCAYLVKNWRSHERILQFINRLFGSLMDGRIGDVTYDEKARLVFADAPDRNHLACALDSAAKVEIHLVERNEADGQSDGDDELKRAAEALADFARAEAEAKVVADLCFNMVERTPLMLPTGVGAQYGDIVILMRSAASEVEALAKEFSKRGIPLDARRTGFFACIEVLDITNLLTILDNPLQDIPLLAALRSPFGCFSVEELATIRIETPRGRFWEALRAIAGGARRAATRESNSAVACEKARAFIEKFNRWRTLARHCSLAERLETILEETGYENWAAAQDRGLQRRANVRRIVSLARQFDASHGEGLYPFLRYVDDQLAAVGDIAPASVESHGAVRLMSVHQSKGLQFPIVIVAGLNKQFNTQDFRGLTILDEEFGLCLKARPPGRGTQYETLPFHLAKHRQRKKLLDEEMRILYVALTRAEHRLLLVGSPSKKAREQWCGEGVDPLRAKSLLDWIGPWLSSDCPECVQADEGFAADWIWRWHSEVATHERAVVIEQNQNVSPEELASLKARLSWSYPHADATEQAAKTSATSLRRDIAEEPELARPATRKSPRKKSDLKANEIGEATHRFLEEASLDSFNSVESMREELARLSKIGVLTAAQAAAVDVEKIAAFWHSPFGRELLQRKDSLHRELIFTSRFTIPEMIAAGAAPQKTLTDEFVVVQGAADLVAVLDRELWLVDFKTDHMPPQMLPARTKEYAVQLRVYAIALQKVYRRKVTRACLYFLALGRTEWVDLTSLS